VRRLCAHCKSEIETSASEIPGNWCKQTTIKTFEAKGCSACHFTGYRGRIALYEVIPIDETARSLIKENKSTVDKYLAKLEVKKLAQRAFDLLLNGDTSLEETYPLLLN
jgi:type II secretory ATPase GspE/PulE/Tfp pilus assembly ATPase PilB-like protein